MAVTEFTLTGDLSELVDQPVKGGTIEIGVYDGPPQIAFPADNQIRVVGGKWTIPTTGLISKSLPHTNIAGANPATFQYEIRIVAFLVGGRKVKLDPIYVTADTGTTTVDLADALDTNAASATWMTGATALLQGYVDDAEAAMLAAQAASLNWRGAWSGASAYAVADAVSYNGSSYRRLVAGTTASTPAADGTNWALLSAKGDTGAPGGSDAAFAGWVADTGSATYAALLAKFATRGIASTQPFLRAIAEGLNDVTMMEVSDSTAASTSNSWVPVSLTALGALYPTHTVKRRIWDDATSTWQAAVTIQTGSGSRTIWCYSLSVNGTNTDYALDKLDAIAAVDPTLIFVAHGHNEDSGTSPALTGPNIRAQMLALTESLVATCPQAALVLMSQNPRVADASYTQQSRFREHARIAHERGFGWIDVTPVFYADPRWSETQASNTLMGTGDPIHPNQNGSDLWGAYHAAVAWKRNTDYPVKAQPPSTLTQGADPIVGINGDFSAWTGSAPDGWTLVNCTASKDYDVYDANGPGYGLKLTPSSAAPSYAYRRIVGADLDAFRARWVSALAKVYVASSVSSTTAGAVGMADDVSTLNDPGTLNAGNLLTNRTATMRHGKLVPAVNMRKVGDKAPFLEIRLYANTGNVSASAVTFTSIDLSQGALPRREARRAAVLVSRAMSTPADLPSLVFSTEPEDYGLADGATITQLTDASGAGNHATQATSGDRATLADTTDIINGKSVAVFPGGKWYTVPLAMPDAVTQFIVYNNYSHNGGTGALFGMNSGSTTAQFTRNTGLSPNGSTGPTLTANARALNSAGNHILCLRYDWTKGYWFAWLDGVLIGSSRSGVNGLPVTFSKPTGNITIGSWRGFNSSNDTGIFKMAGAYICNKALSEAERRGAIAMLASRFAITLP